MAKGLPRSNSRGNALAVPTVRKITYPVYNLSITASAGVAAVGFGQSVLGDFPEGNILVLGGISYMQFSTVDVDIIAAWTGSYGVGTVPNANAAALSGTDIDVIAAATLSAATAKLSPVTRGVGVAPVLFNNTDGSLELNLNLIVDDASFTDSQSAIFLANGYVQLVVAVLGDS